MEEVFKLAKAIDLIARRCSRGIKALTGKAPKPTTEQLAEILRVYGAEYVQVSHSVNTDRLANEAMRVSDVFGVIDSIGWSVIVDGVKEYSRNPLFSRDWNIYRDYAIMEGMPRSYGVGSLNDLIADRYGISVRTVIRICRKVPKAVARYICMTDDKTDGTEMTLNWH